MSPLSSDSERQPFRLTRASTPLISTRWGSGSRGAQSTGGLAKARNPSIVIPEGRAMDAPTIRILTEIVIPFASRYGMPGLTI